MSTTTTSPGGRKRRPPTKTGPKLNSQLTEQFRELRLPMFREHFESQAERATAEPPPEPDDAEVPVEALGGELRREHHNRRRQHDPLGEGQPCTWRTRLIKVAARVTERSRRVLVELSGSWPYLQHYRRISEQVLAFSPPTCDSS